MRNKYYKQELFISHDGGETWTSVGAFQKGALIEVGGDDCSPQMRMNSGTPYCVGYDKYYDKIIEVSYDKGETWEFYSSAATLVEINSTDCGYAPIIPLHRDTISGSPFCFDGDKMAKVINQVSYDNGETWEDTGWSIILIEKDSPDCRYVPPTPPIYRWVQTTTTICIEDSPTPPTPSYSGQYLTFVAQESGTFTFAPTSSNAISYSLNSGSTWTQGNSVSVNNGQKVMWKGTMIPEFYGIGSFSGSTGRFSVEGNIMSLLYGDNFENQTSLASSYHTFRELFQGCSGLTSAENLSLPATTLSDWCYINMFNGCTSLTTAPQLPATTLADWCYNSMFQGCTSLTTAPTLPATTLTPLCYDEMFAGCTSLTTPPQLPATTLASACYRGMFQGCTSLTTVPSLPATTLAHNCYNCMFLGCTSLTTVPSNLLPATNLSGADYCYFSMFNRCSGLTTVPSNLLPATTLSEWCYDTMFAYCTNLTTVPQLPATTLAESCYDGMFIECTSLTTVPSNLLPATNLSGADYCYEAMFQRCSGLTTVPSLPATTLSKGCYGAMFYDCPALTTVPSNLLPATTLATECYGNMFGYCTSLTTVPTLPATTLTSGCYGFMFQRCTSLTTAPELPATILTNDCYRQMFQYCSSLNYIKCLATDISASYCTISWVSGVASAGTFVRDCNTQWSTGESGIPSGWTDNCSSPQPSYSGQYLTFVAQESGTFKFLKSTGNTTDIQYSLDSGSTWTTLASDTNSPTVQSGHTIMWKGTLTPIAYYDWRYPCGIGKFSSSGRFIAEGNAMSLLYGNNFVGQTSLNGKSYAFATLFSGTTTLTSAENLSLPATTLSNNCYGQMFQDCTSLTTAPTLPATTLADWCYCYMFQNCTSLNYIKCLATNISASYCTTDWVKNVRTSGQFWIPQAAISPSQIWSWGDSGIPSGWSWYNIDAYS